MFLPGLFRMVWGLEWADAVAEFVRLGWFRVMCEEVFVDDLAEFGEPVA